MGATVDEAAQRLGRHPAEVRRLLAEGALRGRHRGHQWVVDEADLARIAGHARRRGRPMSARRAWALLWLLEGRDPHWLTSVARSQVRARLVELAGTDADHWRGLLRGRAQVMRCRAHAASLPRLLSKADIVVASGPAQAASHGIDLVALDAPPEIYVRPDRWEELAAQLHVRPTHGEWNLTVRLPPLWPFTGPAGPAVVAADLLDSAEPRAVVAGARVLAELATARTR